ncbi:hypothetical protein K3495_g13656 [Podosphaera aphanis]|nr:hypothetical protein K3495_g13656 [Podosphaera aphanis]
MGCCISIPSSFYPSHSTNPNSSSRAITSSQPSCQAALPKSHPQITSRSERQKIGNSNLASHLNKPLRRFLWSSADRIWTTADLEKERKEFFDTRTSGRPEIWQTVKAVLDILRASKDDESTVDDGLRTAQQILDAAEITLPHSNMSPGVYDSFGAYYPLPKHIICDPMNVVKSATSDKDSQCKTEEYENIIEEDIIRRREEKGKAVINPQDIIEVRVKLSDRDAAPVKVLIAKEDSVRLVAKKIADESNLPSSKSIKIAYMGRILKENQSLKSQGWNGDYVISGLVF